MNKKNKIQTSTSRKVFMICDYALMLLITLICIYPFWYIIIYTFSEGSQVDVNPPVFLPRGFTLSNYKDIFELKGFFHSVLISVLRTVIGTVASVLSCSFLGYLFTKEEMPFRKFLYRFLILTMYISGGMIASYIVMKSYGLLNNFWVYILPLMISAYNIVLIKTFVEQLPASLEESARLDGAGYLTVFTKLILPLSKPIIATVAVFVAVGQWNSWFDAMLYNRMSSNLTTLQYELMKLLSSVTNQGTSAEAMKNAAGTVTPTSVRAAATIITMLPIICIYPFLQKYFVAGLTLGGVKE